MGLFRDLQPPGVAVCRGANPTFGRYIGKYMPDKAYQRFMMENLAIRDRRLAKGLPGRQDTFNSYLEIYSARQARFGKQ